MVLVIVDLVAVPGKRGELAEHVHALLGGGADGLLQYAVGFAKNDPNAIAVVEEWHDDAAHDSFVRTDFFAGFREATATLHATPPSNSIYSIDVPLPPETPIISLL